MILSLPHVHRSICSGRLRLGSTPAEDRLTEVNYGTARKVTYGLLSSATGNASPITEVDYTTTPSPQTLLTTAQYNAFNQQTSRTKSCSGGTGCPAAATTASAYDLNGNLVSETTGSAVRTFTWDQDNRLRTVTPPVGSASTYEYDAKGLRTKQVGATTSKYLLDGPSVFAELDAANATTTSYLTNPQVVDEIVAFSQSSALYYPLTDGLGSVAAITDAAGSVRRALDAGARELSPLLQRDWGHVAAYSLDLDGHVVVFAKTPV
jgi:YD repeat-containing protein